MAKIQGGCLCGAVRYTSDAEPALTAICHCDHCQKTSGSAFSVNVGVPVAGLRVSGAALATFEDLGESGQPVHRRFCGKCGSSLFTDADAFAGISFIKGGSLDDRSWLQPRLHIWCGSAQPWVSIAADATKFPKNPPAG